MSGALFVTCALLTVSVSFYKMVRLTMPLCGALCLKMFETAFCVMYDFVLDWKVFNCLVMSFASLVPAHDLGLLEDFPEFHLWPPLSRRVLYVMQYLPIYMVSALIANFATAACLRCVPEMYIHRLRLLAEQD